ncbi:hypothetical protein FD12_GL002345 [Lentilactobacillus rapi DSM 19907 = JCM 15042]|uniref:Uncharacterized protein n=1 Tax=Lentilactobacillus rapi DSM 19907 = JCM 15042 TaxID=1423795 RepID=A0ABR5PEJ6_9LACO|nr:hypothetical protein FD12_GL002345 [Lentilactobacillus rapi DSM 19907 = JCM 15042]
MGALLLLIALFNVLVMMRIRNFKEQLMGKSTLSQWPTKRKVIWPLVIGFTSMTVISWYLNVGDTSDASWLAIGFWIVALADEIIYYQRKKHGTL